MNAQIPHPFCCLSKDEFRLAFSIAFLEATDLFSGSYDLARFASPGCEGPTDDYIELLWRTCRFLWQEHGVQLGSLEVGPGGSITTAGPVCEGNINYVTQLRGGGLPDLRLAFRTALWLAEERLPGLDAEPLRAALAQIERDRALVQRLRDEAASDRGEKIQRDVERLRDEALASVGVVRVVGTEEVN